MSSSSTPISYDLSRMKKLKREYSEGSPSFRSYLAVSSAHGVPKIWLAKGFMKKAMWFGVCICCTVGLGAIAGNITYTFMQRKVKVELKTLRVPDLPFPAVTVCNMAPYKKSAFAANPSLNGRRKKRSTTCESGWSEIDNECHKVFYPPSGKFYSIVEARETCWNNSAELGVPNSQQLYDFVSNLNKRTFLGVVDCHKEGNFTTVDGSQISTFLQSKIDTSGSINNLKRTYNGVYQDQDCLQTFTSGNLNDAECCSDKILSDSVLCTKFKDNTAYLSADYFVDACADGGETTTCSGGNCDATNDGSTKKCIDSINGYTCEDTTTYELVYNYYPMYQSTALPSTEAETSTVDVSTSPITTTQSDPLETASASVFKPQSTTQDSEVVTTSQVKETTSPTTKATTQPTTTVRKTTTATSTQSTVTTTSVSTTTTLPPPPPSTRIPAVPKERAAFAKATKIFSAVSDLSVDDKQALGFKKEDFLTDCEVNGEECKDSDFTAFYNPIHGNCYTFNSGWNQTTPQHHVTAKTGRRNGLKLIMNLIQEEYTLDVGESAGARVVVHAQNTMPFPEDEGILVPPSTLSSISVAPFAHTRLPAPFSDCITTDASHEEKNVFEELFKVEYTQQGCMKTCYQSWVIRRCACADPFYPRYGIALGTSDDVVFSCTDSVATDTCMKNVSNLYNKNKLRCECPPACRDAYYKSKVSSSKWPSESQRNRTLERLRPKLGGLLDRNSQIHELDLLKIEIFFEELQLVTSKDVPYYDDFGFASDFGGTMGLFLGFSAITVSESFEMLADFIRRPNYKEILKFKKAKVAVANFFYAITRRKIF